MSNPNFIAGDLKAYFIYKLSETLQSFFTIFLYNLSFPYTYIKVKIVVDATDYKYIHCQRQLFWINGGFCYTYAPGGSE